VSSAALFSTVRKGQEGSQHTSHVHSILQLVKKLMERANQPRTALMLPAIVYAHLVLLDMANVRGSPTQLQYPQQFCFAFAYNDRVMWVWQ